MREMLAILLKKEGLEVRSAGSRSEAAETLRGGPVDLVLTDVKLPDGDGLEILRQVKSASPETAVVVMTAYGTSEMAVAARKLGAEDYLLKPFDVDELRIVVERRARPPQPARGEPAAQARGGPDLRPRPRDRRLRGDGVLVRDGARDRADQLDRAHHRRERHRQGAGGAGDPRPLGPRRGAVRRASTAARSPTRCSRASCSATSRARSPTRGRARRACSRRRTAARCSSTRSARPRSRCR